jgi:hypothetical protein
MSHRSANETDAMTDSRDLKNRFQTDTHTDGHTHGRTHKWPFTQENFWSHSEVKEWVWHATSHAGKTIYCWHVCEFRCVRVAYLTRCDCLFTPYIIPVIIQIELNSHATTAQARLFYFAELNILHNIVSTVKQYILLVCIKTIGVLFIALVLHCTAQSVPIPSSHNHFPSVN